MTELSTSTPTAQSVITFAQAADSKAMAAIKAKTGFDLIKVGTVSRTPEGSESKIRAEFNRYCFLPSLQVKELKDALGEMGTEAVSILHAYFSEARASYIRNAIIDGLNQIPASICDFNHRSLWLAFKGISKESAQLYVAEVIKQKAEFLSLVQAAKSLGFAGVEAIPDEKLEEVAAIAGNIQSKYEQTLSSERNKRVLINLVEEGRIITRYAKLSKEECQEAQKWIKGVESPITAQVEALLNQRIKSIEDQIALLGVAGEDMEALNEYFGMGN